jgi:hypothetical protein
MRQKEVVMRSQARHVLVLLVAAAAMLTPVSLASAQDRKGDIQVRGHWVLEVRNPDGTLADRREFYNAFTGPGVMAEVLSGRITAGPWTVLVGSDACANPTPGPCIITESRSSATGVDVFKNLTVDSSGAGQLVLRGFATVLRTSLIERVRAIMGRCRDASTPGSLSNWAPIQCVASSGFDFLSADIQARSVEPGQQVQVTVTISFVSGP